MSNESDKIPNRCNWVLQEGYTGLLIDDKERLIRKYFNEEMVEILSMFKYSNLPKTINERTLELMILGGYAPVFKKGNEVYNGVGKMGGRLDYRYIPENGTFTNTYLNYSKLLKVITPLNVDEIDESNAEDYVCIIPNDYLYYGIIDALREYAEFQTECDLTLKQLLYHLRLPFIASTNDNNVKGAFDTLIANIVKGKNPDAVLGNALYDALKTYPMDNSVQGRIKEVIEAKQYKKAQFENRFGLGTNYNMKRESLTDSEVDADSDTLLPTPDEMLRVRKDALELLNKAFGTNINVEFASAWEIRRKAIEINLDNAEESKEVEVNEETTEVEGNNTDSQA